MKSQWKKIVQIFTININFSSTEKNDIVPVVHKQRTPIHFSEFCNNFSCKFFNCHLLQSRKTVQILTVLRACIFLHKNAWEHIPERVSKYFSGWDMEDRCGQERSSSFWDACVHSSQSALSTRDPSERRCSAHKSIAHVSSPWPSRPLYSPSPRLPTDKYDPHLTSLVIPQLSFILHIINISAVKKKETVAEEAVEDFSLQHYSD